MILIRIFWNKFLLNIILDVDIDGFENFDIIIMSIDWWNNLLSFFGKDDDIVNNCLIISLSIWEFFYNIFIYFDFR
jgi:hypothetical protein